MSSTSDAVWIVEEMLEEILGMVYFRDVQEKFEAEKVTEKSDRIEVDEKCDWVSLIDEEKKSWIDGDASPADCDFCFGKCICEEIDAEMKEVIGEKKKKKEKKFPEYAMMRFNWKEVEPIFKGQSERWMTPLIFFRYDWVELIDGFAA